MGVCVFFIGGVCDCFFFFFQAEDGIRDYKVTGVQTCALPIFAGGGPHGSSAKMGRDVRAHPAAMRAPAGRPRPPGRVSGRPGSRARGMARGALGSAARGVRARDGADSRGARPPRRARGRRRAEAAPHRPPDGLTGPSGPACQARPLHMSGMDQRARYAQVLSQAEATLGGRARLAAFLDVPAEKIAAWLSGEEMPPLEVFLDSLDVIADGPYAPVARPIRVAAIRGR